ncbi:uncharacterized protein YbaR (Trm112 family)/SAM-dependent methyltransferase [Caulobacter ginsengisoli]|uniref:Uncharacterized protein YbaR (Trm112 family)/SAM-dependent methyltransferase n=1 Tax=Caulobacter ginsengisoli TaxID=400775 RepID=A0ABU0IWM7_9CAUL|nr:hypothetical protein [Caulobacter ginsengisoli]MDQ0465751.1 uncharacterized protein YbaR (Trm112 family)/SAM-dependent methyltransferase [Caulobacter ginsengisoli]
MRRATLPILACPTCRRGFELHGPADETGDTRQGYLNCAACGLHIPVIEGFPLFTEPRMHAGQVSAPALEALSGQLFGDPAAYEDYRASKDRRDLWEAYAAFQPFNESTRAAEPLLGILAAHLQPGDVILDVWGRTGWSGEWLAGLFPDNRVISLWEGDSSVLGYRGFRHWLGPDRRAANLDILFIPPNRPLPFRDGAFGAVYALDSLHRYELYPFAGECLRVARPDAALLFAHLHLSNAEPDPFFERGCRQLHGRDYRAWLDGVLAGGGRQGWVLSEADLFNARAGDRLDDSPDTPHYNGAVLIADPARAPMIAPPPALPDPDGRFLVNPLLRLRPGRGDLVVDPGLRSGEVGRLLSRHPIYERRLPAEPLSVSPIDWLILCLALTGHTRSRIDAVIGPSKTRPTDDPLTRLVAAEVLLPVTVSPQAHEMQRFHANQLPAGEPGLLLPRLIEALWDDPKPAVTLPDGASLTGGDFARAVAAAARLLEEEGLRAGDRLGLPAATDPLVFILLVAGMAMGLDIEIGVRPDSSPTSALALMIPGAGEEAPIGGRYRRPSGDDGALAERLGALLAADLAPPRVRTGGHLEMSVGGRWLSLESTLLIEAAVALRHVTGADRRIVEDFGALDTLLFGLATLFRRDELIFGGRPEPHESRMPAKEKSGPQPARNVRER